MTTPAYVHRILDAWLTGAPLDFQGAEVPADVQERLADAFLMPVEAAPADVAERTCANPGDQEHDHAMCEDVTAEAVAGRRRDLWCRVSDAVSIGATPPGEVRISDDGWSMDLVVADQEQVRVWAAQLELGELQVRVYSPGKREVVREVFASRSRAYAVRVSCIERLDPLPPAKARQVEAAYRVLQA